jgi:putative membrane protein
MEVKTSKPASNAKAISAILAISLAIFVFLIWIIYFKERIDYSSEIISSLPAVNAGLNGLSSILLSLGFRAIKRGNRILHMRFMISGLISSGLFLISYIVYHTFHGDTPFEGQGLIRPVYFFILITHIVLSAVVVPMVLTSLYFAVTKKFSTHKKIARFTFPVWLYVSITGVLIFVLLKSYS